MRRGIKDGEVIVIHSVNGRLILGRCTVRSNGVAFGRIKGMI